MKKACYLLTVLGFIFITVLSCKKNDDGVDVIPPRDRGEEAIASQAEIETYLATHFYNYEEFDNPPADFKFLIKFDTIAGDNSSKTPLIDQVSSKMVPGLTHSSLPHFRDFYFRGSGFKIRWGRQPVTLLVLNLPIFLIPTRVTRLTTAFPPCC